MKLFSNNFYKRILVTGGLGFIGSTLIRRLLLDRNLVVYNLDKVGYASDSKSIDEHIKNLNLNLKNESYKFLKHDLCDSKDLREIIKAIQPDIIFHLAAESHVDQSISSPISFLKSNVIGTFNLLEAARNYWQFLPEERKTKFRFHHISTDEVYGSLGELGSFTELTPYSPRSPYSASKASSDHFVNAWFHTYGLPVIITNCSNNYGAWQFPEKLIPLAILRALEGKEIPMYGDGTNIRDWLYVDDHVDALLLSVSKGKIGKNYCIGGSDEKSNKEVLLSICSLLDELRPSERSYCDLIKPVDDRPGHDWRYSIDSSLIRNELGWEERHSFESGIRKTVKWYLKNLNWAKLMSNRLT